MNFCFTRIVSSHVIYTIAIVVHTVLPKDLACDNVGKCLCSYNEYYNEVSCSDTGLRIIPGGLNLISASTYNFAYNYLDTTNEDFMLSWKTFLSSVNESIYSLYFYSNPLISIPEGFFDEKTAGVSWLDLSKCQISSLSENAFSNLVNLEVLFMTENPLGVLPAGLFRNQKILYTLYLDLCELRLDEDMFTPLSGLEFLSLDNNNIKFLPANVCRNQSKLVSLSLGKNKLEYLPLEFLKENTHMTRLYLDNNRLEYLPNDFLMQNPNIRELNLENNRLEYLPPDFLMRNPKMWRLTLSRNKIKIMSFDWLLSLVQRLITHKIKLVASDPFDRYSDIPPFDCIECLDCNFKMVEEFNEWIEKYNFNATEELDMQNSCNNGTHIVKLETDYMYPTLAGIVTALIVTAIGTVASLTAVLIVIKRIVKTDHFNGERDENHAKNDIEIELPGYIMGDDHELFRNIPAVDHRIYIS